MKNSLLLAFWLTCHAVAGQSQSSIGNMQPLEVDSTAIRYAQTINESDLKNYLSILASDALGGRETGSRGQKMAAAFIREHFKDNKLRPMVTDSGDSLYFQEFSLYKTYNKEIYLQNKEKSFRHPEDVIYYGDAKFYETGSIILQFVGDGEEDDYKGLDVEGKMVAFFSNSMSETRSRTKIADDLGATAMIIINTDTRAEFQEFRDRHYQEEVTISKNPGEHGENVVFLGHTEMIAELLEVDFEKLIHTYKKKGKSSKNRYRKLYSSIDLKIEKISELFDTENVLGFVEGDAKKNELVVVTAHYDHVGSNGDLIYNGADDDGSGTAAIMEMAQAFAIAKKNGHGPQRSLLFMAVAGEENGLLGSEYYSEHPAWPLVETVANLNIDMIGRVDPFHENSEEYVYVIGSDRLSMDLHSINEQVNKLYTGLKLDYKYNAEDDPNRFYYRSDHYNFAKHNIPIIFYFNGTHADYHQPTDTIEKIRFDLLKKRTDLVFYCAWELANRAKRIRLN